MTNQPTIEFKKTSAKRYDVFVNSEWTGYFERRYHNPGNAGCGRPFYYYDGSVRMNGKFVDVRGGDVKTAKSKITTILTQE